MRLPTLLLLTLVALLPGGAVAQISNSLGLRGGGGPALDGGFVYTGQVEFTEVGDDNSIEVAVVGYANHRLKETSFVENDVGSGVQRTRYHEQTDAVGLALTASFLVGHGNGGGYVALGAGVGTFKADWRLESPTDSGLGTPFSTNGSFVEDDSIVLGSVYSIGAGYRLNSHMDLRGLIPILFVSGSGQRDLKFVPALHVSLALGS